MAMMCMRKKVYRTTCDWWKSSHKKCDEEKDHVMVLSWNVPKGFNYDGK